MSYPSRFFRSRNFRINSSNSLSKGKTNLDQKYYFFLTSFFLETEGGGERGPFLQNHWQVRCRVVVDNSLYRTTIGPITDRTHAFCSQSPTRQKNMGPPRTPVPQMKIKKMHFNSGMQATKDICVINLRRLFS